MNEYIPALPTYDPDDGNNERSFGALARKCAEIYGGLPRPAMQLLIFHLVRHSNGQQEGNYLVEMMLAHDVEEISEAAATTIGNGYNTLLNGELLETTGKTVELEVFGEPDHQEDLYKLGAKTMAILQMNQ
jgi:hypothetical protein